MTAILIHIEVLVFSERTREKIHPVCMYSRDWDGFGSIILDHWEQNNLSYEGCIETNSERDFGSESGLDIAQKRIVL